MKINLQLLAKSIIYVFIVAFIIAGLGAFWIYKLSFAPNVLLEGKDHDFLLIPTGSKYADVLKILDEKKYLKNLKSFEWTARRKNYPTHIKAGRFKISSLQNNNQLINILRSGKQEPVMLTFNNIRTLDQLADLVSQDLEIKQDKLLNLLCSHEVQTGFGLNDNTIICMFIPNTYQFFWNTSEIEFINRMHREYENFWDQVRREKAKELNLTKEQVMTLASIVNEETDKNEEKAKIAGVYLNRLKKGIRLQADPTIVYVVGNFTLQRVLRQYYQIDSPYNTYLYGGLPPGPICIPEISSIDAVLNYEKHNYLYFCAKPDFSGYHVFARTLEEHNHNAQIYRHELNKRKIYR